LWPEIADYRAREASPGNTGKQQEEIMARAIAKGYDKGK
jgi:hypothetical protein